MSDSLDQRNALPARAAAELNAARAEPGTGPRPWSANTTFGVEGMHIAGLGAEELVVRYGTPLVVIDEDDFRARCRVFRAAFPRVLFAVKAFTAHFLIRIAQEEGLGLLASTDGEVEACLRAGGAPSSIAFHGNNKSDAELALAVRAGIGLVTADNAEELDRLDAVARAAGVRQSVLLRVAPGVSGDTHAYLDTGGSDSKFGTPIAGGLALDAIKRAATLPNIQFEGVQAHVGSQLLDADPYLSEIDRLFDLLAAVRDHQPDLDVGLVDVGGGFGVTYTQEMPDELPRIAATMLARVQRAADERGLRVPTIMVEPGRALVANPACTLYAVGNIKTVPTGTTLVAVDGGMSDNIRPALYGANYTVSLASPPRGHRAGSVTVVGRHCESGDVLAKDVDLPDDLRRGDVLAFAATGAYGYSMASNYNRVGKPAVVAVSNGKSRLVLRREDAGDLDRLEVDRRPDPEVRLPEGVVIRPAEPRDAASFHRMWSEIVDEGLVRSQEVNRPVRHYKTLFRRAWTERGAWIAAVDAEGEIVGFLSATREEHPVTAHVATIGLGVRKDWRGKGIGGALVAESIRWAASVGVQKIILSVYPSNTPAVALYRKFGFLEEGRLVNQSRKSYGYEDEILMGRWLG